MDGRMIHLISGSVAKQKIQTLAVPVFEDADTFEDAGIEFCIRQAKKLPEFSGKDGERVILYQPDGTAVDRMILVGLGHHSSANLETFRSFAGRIVTQCRKMGLTGLTIAVP
jgi:leucyl aminopeptidase